MPFKITPVQNNSDSIQKDDIEISRRADSRIDSPASSIQHSPESQNSSLYETGAWFPLPQIQSYTLPMIPMPTQPLSYQTQNVIRSFLIQIPHQI